MNEGFDQLAKSVDEALGAFEFGPFGLREYQDVTRDAQALQLCLRDHMQSFADLGQLDEQDEAAVISILDRRIDQEFDQLDSIDRGDEVITSGKGLVMFVDSYGKYAILPLDDNQRLHGRVEHPYVQEVPTLESAIDQYGWLIEDKPHVMQTSVVLKLDTVSLESQSEESEFYDFSDETVFLPLIYPDQKLKRRILQ